MKLEEGEIIQLDDNKDYLVLKSCNANDQDYVSLVTVEKPIKMEIRKQILKDNKITLEEVTKEELSLILPLMKK